MLTFIINMENDHVLHAKSELPQTQMEWIYKYQQSTLIPMFSLYKY